MKNGKFISKWGVNDHQMCCVKFSLTPTVIIYKKWWSFRILGLVHNCNLYVSKDVVLKHTPAKFD